MRHEGLERAAELRRHSGDEAGHAGRCKLGTAGGQHLDRSGAAVGRDRLVAAKLPAPAVGSAAAVRRLCGGDCQGLMASLMSALGHVWTAPWQELSDVAAALVGCGHVSGLLMRQVWPLALMLCADRVPIVNTHF